MAKRGTSHFRKAEDRRRMEKLSRKHSYFTYQYVPDEQCNWRKVKKPYYKQFWMSEQRKSAKHYTNKVCRHIEEIPNHSGYRKLHDYWWDIW